MNLKNTLITCIEKEASDLHVKSDEAPRVRLNGQLQPLNFILNQDEILAGLKELIDEKKLSKLSEKGSVDGAFKFQSKRFRYNLFKQSNSICLSLRMLSDQITSLQSLGIPEVLYKVCDMHNGLVLVSGPTGSGKSTTLSALIDHINHKQSKHIITIEEPIEYIYESQKSLLNQREVGVDTPDFHTALVDSLRQDPDIILIGEIREIKTIKTAITAAETGHLVFATVHSEDSSSAIERLIAVFPAEEQDAIRQQLSLTLRAVIAQKLVFADGRAADEIFGKAKRVPVCEILFANNAVRNQVATGKTRLIPSTIEMSQQEGMQTADKHLSELLKQGILSHETVLRLAKDQSAI